MIKIKFTKTQNLSCTSSSPSGPQHWLLFSGHSEVLQGHGESSPLGGEQTSPRTLWMRFIGFMTDDISLWWWQVPNVSPTGVRHEVQLREALAWELPSETPFLCSSIRQSALATADTVLMGAGRKAGWSSARSGLESSSETLVWVVKSKGTALRQGPGGSWNKPICSACCWPMDLVVQMRSPEGK